MSARMKISTRWQPRAIALAAVLAAATAAPASAVDVTPTPIHSDTFTNDTSQHATEVEPDTFSHHGTTIATMQVGRFFNGGASDIGWSRTTDGINWTQGNLPGLTAHSPQPNGFFERVSDTTVAYDAAHRVWLISSIPLQFNTLNVPTVFVSRSTDDGVSFGNPVSIPPPPVRKVDLDKNWTTCDNHPDSDFYGNCYTEFDNFGEGDLEYMSTSTDGGQTWSTPVFPAGKPKGLGGQPVVQPDGTVVVPFEALNGKIEAFSSTDGGQTWGHVAVVDNVTSHANSGGLRTSPLPSAEIDGDGTVYVAWQDCRFQPKCSANDIVFSKSSDGVNWGPTARIPIADVGTTQNDHFIPGIAVDPSTAGSDAHVALTYYFYTDANCAPADCVLQAGTISSDDGGAHWNGQDTVGQSMKLNQIAATSQGRMVGDYISTSFIDVPGNNDPYTTAVDIGKGTPTSTQTFDEATYAPVAPITVASGGAAATTAGAHQFTGQGTGETHHALRND
jgi:hypothetical protein